MIRSPLRYFKTSCEIIQPAVMMYIRFPLSQQNVEDLLYERCIDVSSKASDYGSIDSGHCLQG